MKVVGDCVSKRKPSYNACVLWECGAVARTVWCRNLNDALLIRFLISVDVEASLFPLHLLQVLLETEDISSGCLCLFHHPLLCQARFYLSLAHYFHRHTSL